MATEPWKPNHFLFDFIVFWIIVSAIDWVITKASSNEMTLKSFAVIIIVTTLITVTGRAIQGAMARKRNWIQTVPGTTDDTGPVRAYDEQTIEKWQRNQREFDQESLRNDEKHERAMAEVRDARTKEIEALERQLELYKNVPSEEPYEQD